MLRQLREKSESTYNRRTILRTSAALAAVGVAGTAPTGAQSDEDLPVSIEMFVEEEYITITNTGDEDLDLTGYSVNFEAEDDDYNQIRQLSGEVVIAPGDTITVPTGAREVTTGTIVELDDPYTGEVLRNDGSDVIALIDPNGNERARSDDEETDDTSDTDDSDESDTTEETDDTSDDEGDGDEDDTSDDEETDDSDESDTESGDTDEDAPDEDATDDTGADEAEDDDEPTEGTTDTDDSESSSESGETDDTSDDCPKR